MTMSVSVGWDNNAKAAEEKSRMDVIVDKTTKISELVSDCGLHLSVIEERLLGPAPPATKGEERKGIAGGVLNFFEQWEEETTGELLDIQCRLKNIRALLGC